MSKRTFLELLRDRTILFDGAMGSLLLSQDLGSDDFRGRDGCCEILNITRPELVEQAHRSYLDAGADVVETNSFQGSRVKLEELGFGELTHEINLAAARNARRAADSFSSLTGPRFVVGSIGPTGQLPSSSDPELSTSFDSIRKTVSEQASALIEGGVDAILLETQQDIMETKAGICGVRDCFARAGRDVPVLVHIALDENGRMLMGTDVVAATSILEPLGVDVIGIDCSFGPDEMRDFIRQLAQTCSRYIGCVPNAGFPENRGGSPFYPLGPADMAEKLVSLAVEYGIDIIGGCCGSTPAHTREMHRRLRRETPAKRRVKRSPSVASPYRSVLLHQEPKPLLIGERLNTTGSKRTKRMVESGDYQGLVSIASEQEANGSHLLDVCMAGPSEKEHMARAVRVLSQSVEAPLVIDSRDGDVIRRGLQVYPGRAIVNSFNLEKGEKEFSRMLELVKEFGACAVVMTITESGMALSAQEKLTAAHRMREIAVERIGLYPEDLLFDCLTLPLSTGDRSYESSAKETLGGIERIKEELDGCLTILGISNVSYGLPPEVRRVLDSTFLYHAIEKGLDAAIVNSGELVPYQEIALEERELCEDLIFCRNDGALPRLLERLGSQKREVPVGSLDTAEHSTKSAIRSRILNRDAHGLEKLLDSALEEASARELLEEVLLPAMEEVGRRFDSGEMILPFVLQSSEVMSKATSYLEKHLGSGDLGRRGKIVLATVFGDVHDIGKNLVKAVISNNGYTVYDLGKRVPVDAIVREAQEKEADVIGLSALLVSTSKEMKACVGELSRSGMSTPVIVGGAVVNQTFANRISVLEDGSIYPGGVFYARDAFDGLEILGSLMKEREKVQMGYRKRVTDFINEERELVRARNGRPGKGLRMERISVPFSGARVRKMIPAEEVFPYLDTHSLFRVRWGARRGYTTELRDREFLPALNELKGTTVRKGFYEFSSVYGYFDCRLSDEALIVYSGDETIGLDFSGGSELKGYFLPREEKDIAVLGVVTVGARVKELEDELMAKGETKKAFYLHGLSAELAEALANHLQVKIGMELGIEKNMGRRYSPGYSSWPELSEQKKLFSILKPERIGVKLTEAFQMVPEHSISFLFCPRARRG